MKDEKLADAPRRHAPIFHFSFFSFCSYSKKTLEEPKDWYEKFNLLKGVIQTDKVTSLCEMKYSSRPYSMSAEEAKKIRHREDEIAACFPTQKQVLVSLVTNRSPKKNEHYNSVILSNLTLDNLFED